MNAIQHQFATFCASKDPQESYDASDATVCALGQFYASIGCRPYASGYVDAQGRQHRYPRDIYNAAMSLEGWTFGALAERLAGGAK